MGCIEIPVQIGIIVGNERLIETWDVLKSRITVRITIKIPRLIETWDVLKSLDTWRDLLTT